MLASHKLFFVLICILVEGCGPYSSGNMSRPKPGAYLLKVSSLANVADQTRLLAVACIRLVMPIVLSLFLEQSCLNIAPDGALLQVEVPLLISVLLQLCLRHFYHIIFHTDPGGSSEAAGSALFDFVSASC